MFCLRVSLYYMSWNETAVFLLLRIADYVTRILYWLMFQHYIASYYNMRTY